MKLRTSSSIVILFLFCNICMAQNSSCIKEINNDIWSNFSKAFENVNINLFESIHSADLIRVGGDYKTIRDKNNYIADYKKRWKNDSKNQTISFRFLERICDDSKASERGIYKLVRNPNTKNEKVYFGKFHVLLRKENNQWKILVDYDSTENNTINIDAFNKAHALDDLYKY